MEEKKPQSPFFAKASELLQESMELRQENDAAIMIISDENYQAALIGGKHINLHHGLVSAMRRDPQFADVVIKCVADYLLQLPKEPILRIPPLPEDGVAEASAPKPGRYRIGIDLGDDNNQGS